METWIALKANIAASGVAGRFEKQSSGFSERGPETARRRAATDPVRRTPKDAKPFKSVGSGVIELALRYASDAYRLHAFQKKSKRGIETPKRDVDLIKRRYAEAQELAREYEKTKIN